MDLRRIRTSELVTVFFLVGAVIAAATSGQATGRAVELLLVVYVGVCATRPRGSRVSAFLAPFYTYLAIRYVGRWVGIEMGPAPVGVCLVAAALWGIAALNVRVHGLGHLWRPRRRASA